MDTAFKVRNADVHVHTEDQKASGDHLQLVDQELISVAVIDLLLAPFREGMCRCRDDRHSLFLSKGGNDTSELCDILTSFLNICANSGADLDHRLDHLGLHLFAEKETAFVENFGYV